MSILTTKVLPTDADVRNAISEYLGNEPFSLERFSTGLCHYVYDVTPQAQQPFVLRMGCEETRDNLIGSVYWTGMLSPLKIPIPKILYKNFSGQFPYTILERIRGTDLGNVYTFLTPSQKQFIAEEIVHWQSEVRKLPAAKGYGFGFTYEDRRLKSSWVEVIEDQITRAREWIVTHAICNVTHVDRVEDALASHKAYLMSVQAKPFLHDTTTKNVIISEGKLSGIVDIDDLCFGDSLFVVALTYMALLSREYETDYIKFWCNKLKLSNEQRKIMNFYTAIFCVTFMGEIGQKFNKDIVEVDLNQVKRLENILDMLLKEEG